MLNDPIGSYHRKRERSEKHGISETNYEDVRANGNGIPGRVFIAGIPGQEPDFCQQDQSGKEKQPNHF